MAEYSHVNEQAVMIPGDTKILKYIKTIRKAYIEDIDKKFKKSCIDRVSSLIALKYVADEVIRVDYGVAVMSDYFVITESGIAFLAETRRQNVRSNVYLGLQIATLLAAIAGLFLPAC